MGVFSWRTCDTGEIIWVTGNEPGVPVRPVFLLQPGGLPAVREHAYEGYGVFGGVDASEWVAAHNDGPETVLDADWDAWLPEWREVEPRRRGIALHCAAEGRQIALRFPLKFSFDPDAVYEDHPMSEYAENQGYFAEEEGW